MDCVLHQPRKYSMVSKVKSKPHLPKADANKVHPSDQMSDFVVMTHSDGTSNSSGALRRMGRIIRDGTDVNTFVHASWLT